MNSVKMDDAINEMLREASIPDVWVGKVGGADPESAAGMGEDPVLGALVAKLPIVTR